MSSMHFGHAKSRKQKPAVTAGHALPEDSRDVVITDHQLRQTGPVDRQALIAAAAYAKAQARGFAPGSELDDWLSAEAEIETRLREVALSCESLDGAGVPTPE